MQEALPQTQWFYVLWTESSPFSGGSEATCKDWRCWGVVGVLDIFPAKVNAFIVSRKDT